MPFSPECFRPLLTFRRTNEFLHFYQRDLLGHWGALYILLFSQLLMPFSFKTYPPLAVAMSSCVALCLFLFKYAPSRRNIRYYYCFYRRLCQGSEPELALYGLQDQKPLFGAVSSLAGLQKRWLLALPLFCLLWLALLSLFWLFLNEPISLTPEAHFFVFWTLAPLLYLGYSSTLARSGYIADSALELYAQYCGMRWRVLFLCLAIGSGFMVLFREPPVLALLGTLLICVLCYLLFLRPSQKSMEQLWSGYREAIEKRASICSPAPDVSEGAEQEEALKRRKGLWITLFTVVFLVLIAFLW